MNLLSSLLSLFWPVGLACVAFCSLLRKMASIATVFCEGDIVVTRLRGIASKCRSGGIGGLQMGFVRVPVTATQKVELGGPNVL